MRMIRTLFILLALLQGAAAFAATATVGDTPVLPVVRTLDGKSIDLNALRGRVLMVTYFSSTCPFCAAEAPKLQKLARDTADRMVVVAINIDVKEADQKTRAENWVKRFGLTHPVSTDYAAVQRVLGKPKGLPVHFVFDRNGTLQRVDVGEIFDEDFDEIARMAR